MIPFGVTIRLLLLLSAATLLGQSPFTAARDHYKLVLDNEWVQVARVFYKPGESSPEHDHPARPAVFIYTTDGGPIEFTHDHTGKVTRPAVKAGQIRYARPVAEKHEAKYLGDQAAEYVRIELKTAYVDPLNQDVRLPGTAPAGKVYEDGQIAIIKMHCAADGCGSADLLGTPAVVVQVNGTAVSWVAPGAKDDRPKSGDYIRVQLKSKPPEAEHVK